MPKARKKSYTGWVSELWDMAKIESPTCQDVNIVEHDTIYKTKSDYCAFGLDNCKRIRITMEEIN